jgi:hypothetical protein
MEVLCALGANSARLQGNNVQADHCFLHHNSSPTLGVALEPPHSFNCFSCGAKGKTIYGLIRRARGLRTDNQAAAWLLKNFSVGPSDAGELQLTSSDDTVAEERFTLPETVMAAYPLDLEGDRYGWRAIEYLRLCAPETAERLRLGYDRRNHRLVFPVRWRDGQIAGLIGRAMRPGDRLRYYNYDEGSFKKSLCLMGDHLPLVKGPLVVCEGPTDFVHLVDCGIDNPRAFMGAEFSTQQLNLLLSLERDIVAMFDADPAGRAALGKFCKAIAGRRRIYTVQYPSTSFRDGKADPRQVPKAQLRQMVRDALSSARFLA